MPKQKDRPGRNKGHGMANANVVKLKVSKRKHFEVIVHEGMVVKFREGRAQLPLQSVVVVNNIFTDARKAKQATPDELKEAFKTTDFDQIAKQILEKGESQTTSGERKDMADVRSRQIVEFIHRNFRNSRTKGLMTLTRITEALKKMRISPQGEVATEAKRLVKEGIKNGTLSVVRHETQISIDVPAEQRNAADQLFKVKGCTVISKRATDDKVVYDIGCLPGELDAITAAIEHLGEGNEAKSGNPRKGGRKGGRKGKSSSPAAARRDSVKAKRDRNQPRRKSRG